MSDFHVISTRGPLAETMHQVSAAIVSVDGRLVGRAGDPDLVTFWRSAAKPFQLLPLVVEGGVDHYHLDEAMLALACGSHNAEPIHREVGARWLDAIGATEADLACGGHPSILPALANSMIHDDVVATPLWSNCSGKHASLLGQAKLNGWATSGYEERSHPVQERVAQTIAKWTGLESAQLQWGIDGCTAAAVALPLRAMALAYAEIGATADAALSSVRRAIIAHPYLIAGADRLDTALMQAWSGRVIAKIGADGVYSASLPTLGLGVALKIHDGNMNAACQALVAVLDATVRRFGSGEAWPLDSLAPWSSPPILNTRGTVTGHGSVAGELSWL